MSHITHTDFFTEVQKGNVQGHTMVHKFGRNAAVANGVFEHVSLLSAVAVFLTAPTTVRIKAGGDAADTAAGVGAQAITIEGIDDSLNAVSESVATAGASASAATTALFWRVHRAYVTPASAGTYGAANTAAVIIENSGGGTDLISIGIEEGQSQYGGYAVPTGFTGYLIGTHLMVDASKAADWRLLKRANFNDFSTPFQPIRIGNYWDGLVGHMSFQPRSPGILDAVSDVWYESEGSGAGTEVSVDFEILLIAN